MVGNDEVVKYASAHDLRRSFGERWASRNMPQVLMEITRHESIETTLKYSVGRNAQSTADVLWDAHGRAVCNISGNNGQNPAESTEPGPLSNPELSNDLDRRGAGRSRTDDGGFAICPVHYAPVHDATDESRKHGQFAFCLSPKKRRFRIGVVCLVSVGQRVLTLAANSIG